MAQEPSLQELARLKALLDGALAGLENVEPKRLFGCDGWFAQGNIFALVWKEGRLGLRFNEPDLYAEALDQEGASQWRMDGKAVRHWVLLPRAWHSRPDKLRAWGRKAYALAVERTKARPAVFKKIRRQP